MQAVAWAGTSVTGGEKKLAEVMRKGDLEEALELRKLLLRETGTEAVLMFECAKYLEALIELADSGKIGEQALGGYHSSS